VPSLPATRFGVCKIITPIDGDADSGGRELDRRAEATGAEAVRVVAGVSSRKAMNIGLVVRPWFEELKARVPTK